MLLAVQEQVRNHSGNANARANWLKNCFHDGMIIKQVSYSELLDEYRYALGIWTETKALYPSDGLEVFQATLVLEELEKQLERHLQPPVLLAA